MIASTTGANFDQSPERVRDFIYRHCRNNYFYLHLEPTNACNTHCTMCPREAMDRPYRMMTWETFYKIMRVILPSEILMISIVGFGEPMLHKDLPSMIDLIRRERADLIIKMTTNGSLLSSCAIERLYSAGLDIMEISFVGTCRETYEGTMKLDFEEVLKSIDHLLLRGHKFLISTFDNGEGAEQIRSFWAGRGVENVQIKGFHRRGGYLQIGNWGRANPLGDYRHLSKANLPHSFRRVSNLRSEECHKLFMFLHVSAEGRFIPCVQEINDRNVLFTIDDIQSYQEILDRMARVEPTFDICHNCEMKDQDHLDYYAKFLLRYFPDHIRRWFS